MTIEQNLPEIGNNYLDLSEIGNNYLNEQNDCDTFFPSSPFGRTGRPPGPFWTCVLRESCFCIKLTSSWQIHHSIYNCTMLETLSYIGAASADTSWRSPDIFSREPKAFRWRIWGLHETFVQWQYSFFTGHYSLTFLLSGKVSGNYKPESSSIFPMSGTAMTILTFEEKVRADFFAWCLSDQISHSKLHMKTSLNPFFNVEERQQCRIIVLHSILVFLRTLRIIN